MPLAPVDISVAGLNAIRMEEGRALRAYQDAVGVWTVGYGLTNMDKGLPWKVQRGLVITAEEAEWHLYDSLKRNYEPDVRSVLNFGTIQNGQGALDGGMGFHFNTGGIKRASWPRALNAGNMAAAETNLKSWCRAGGRVLSDLVNRRAHEWAIMSRGDYGRLVGPTIVIPNASGHETYSGHAELLTSMPHPPGTAPSPQHTAADEIAPPVVQGPGVLRLGSQGQDVITLQNKLNSAGEQVSVTGVFDEATDAAVRHFQGAHPNLTQDGAVGPATDAALDRAAALRQKLATAAKTATPAAPGAWIAFHNWVSAHHDQLVLGAIAVAVVLVVGYIVYSYRHEIGAKLNELRGKVVP